MLVQQTAQLLRMLLFEVLRKLGFGARFYEWIAILLSTLNTRVLLNGDPGPYLAPAGPTKRGPLVAIVVGVSHKHA
jgi:hypothetical protein